MLSEETTDVAAGRSSAFVAGVTAIAAGVVLAVVGALGAPEAAPIGHWSVFVGMALSVAGIVAGRPPAREPRGRASEVQVDAHR